MAQIKHYIAQQLEAGKDIHEMTREFKLEVCHYALKQINGNICHAAKFVGMHRNRTGVIKRSKRTLKRNRMIKALDDACRERVFERDHGKCQRCGSQGSHEQWSHNLMQWSHVHSRRHLCTRWDDDNSKVLCLSCHCWWGNNPGLAYDWFAKKWPERWERITRVLQLNPKVRVEDLYAELKEQATANGNDRPAHSD